MSLTIKQRSFLGTIPPDLDLDTGERVWWDCEPEELRTALALHRRELIEFHYGVPDRATHFSVRQRPTARTEENPSLEVLVAALAKAHAVLTQLRDHPEQAREITAHGYFGVALVAVSDALKVASAGEGCARLKSP